VAASRQAGIPISVKLILATSVVVATAVGIVTWFARSTMDTIAEEQISAREQDGLRAIEHNSALITSNAAVALSFPLPNHVKADIMLVLTEATKQDDDSGENQVKWIAVVESGAATYDTPGIKPRAKKSDPKVFHTVPSADEVVRYLRLLKDADTDRTKAVVRASLGNSEWVYRAPITAAGIKDAYVLAGVTTAGLEARIKKDLESAKDKTGDAQFRALLVSLVVLAIGILLAAIQGAQLARPIKGLTAQAERIGSGDRRSASPTTAATSSASSRARST
jgi:hypothetical protein